MRQIRFSIQAGRDIEGIEEYISRDNPDAAARLILAIQNRCLMLSEHPGMGKIGRICFQTFAVFRMEITSSSITPLRMELKLSGSCTVLATFMNCSKPNEPFLSLISHAFRRFLIAAFDP